MSDALDKAGQLVISELSRENAKLEFSRLLGPLGDVLEQADVQELMINNSKNIFVERNGKISRLNASLSPEAIEQAIITAANINLDKASLIFDGDLPGYRIAAARPPIAVNGACMSIRKHGIITRKLEDYLDSGAFSPRLSVKRKPNSRPSNARIAKGHGGVAEFFKWMITSRQNFIVCGGTSSGKTTFLNMLLALMAQLDPERRLFVSEDTRELVISLKNHVRFLSKASAGIHARQLVRLSLRMRPDSIWFGEIRGAEAFDLLDAYETGHPGSGVSMHADTPLGALIRMEFFVKMSDEGRSLETLDVRAKIASTFSFVIHCGSVNGLRYPLELVELHGATGGVYQTTTLWKKELDYV